MEQSITILGVVGSIVSIVGFVSSIIKKRQIFNIILYFILMLVSGFGAYWFYKYNKVIEEKLNIEKRKESIKAEAKGILDSASYISYFDPGEYEGLVLSTLALLEKNRDIFPETFEVYKTDVVEKLHKSNQRVLMSDRREELELAGKSAQRILKTLAV